MILIGVVGGIASGKSLVSKRLVALGADLLDADRVGHDVLRESSVEQAIRDRWGDGVFDQNGEVDRRAVAEIVFADPQAMAFLEELTHPRIEGRMREWIARAVREGRFGKLVLDAPLMFEAGWGQMCDIIVFVDSPRELRLQRACRRGWAEADFQSREAAQQTLETKRKRADVILDNSSTLEHLYSQVDRFWQSLEHRRPRDRAFT